MMKKIQSMLNRYLDRAADYEKEPLHNGQEFDDEVTRAPRLRAQWKTFVVVLVLASAVISISSLLYIRPVRSIQVPIYSRPSYLRTVFTASTPHEGLCKSIISAAVVEYAAPILLKSSNPSSDETAKPHAGKLSGILAYLNTLDANNDDNLVLIVDEDNAWFQLRAKVLIDRYYAINRLADAQISQQLGRGKEEHNISQRVLFSRRKNLQPDDDVIATCHNLDANNSPVNFTGSINPSNDEKVDLFARNMHNSLSTGMILGPVRDLRILLTEGLELANAGLGCGSPDALFNLMYLNQEQSRASLARQFRTENSMQNSFLAWIGLKKTPAPATPSSEPTQDFGIGIDHDGEILLSTTFSSATTWLNFSAPTTNLTLQNDISTSKPPFKTYRRIPFPSGPLPRLTPWTSIPLLTQTSTNTVPALIHHSSPSSDSKKTQWNQTWYFPYLRPLMDAHVIEPRGPVAVTTDPEDGTMKEWWSADNEKGGVRVFEEGEGESFRYYDTFCGGVWDSVMGDGRGAWRDPRMGFD